MALRAPVFWSSSTRHAKQGAALPQPLSSENLRKLLVWEKSAKLLQLLLQVNNAAAGGTVKSNCFLGYAKLSPFKPFLFTISLYILPSRLLVSLIITPGTSKAAFPRDTYIELTSP